MKKLNRREFLQTIGTGAAAFSFMSLLSRCENPGTDRFDNIVVIIGDDHAAYALACYGNDIIRTPNLDRMSARGMQFNYAYANAPVCSASRQSVLTGRYPHAAGVTLLTTPFPPEQITIAEHLQKYQFQTGLIGKAHFNNSLSHGFDYRIDSQDYHYWLEENPPQNPPAQTQTRPPWRPFRDPARIWLNADMLPSAHYDEDSEGTFLANKAREFLHDNRENRFCLFVGFHEPHSPFNFPIEYAGKYKPENMPVPRGSPEDDQWIPEIFRDLTEEDKQGIIASYYTSVEYLDKNVGLILDEIRDQGLEENTLVIYIGDQGYLLGHHKRFEKHMMWEEAVHSPLLLQGGTKLQPGVKIGELVEYIDLTPTILDALKIPFMDTIQGKSFHPILQGETTGHKEYVFSEFLIDNKAMVRSYEWKYIFTTGKRDLGQGYATGNPPPGITHRLYNMRRDPNETTNVAGKPENMEILTELQHEMVRIFRETYPEAEQVPEDLTVEEQLVRFCVPPEEDPDLKAK